MQNRPDEWDDLLEARLAGELDDVEWSRLRAAYGEALDRALAEERALRRAVADLPQPALPAALRERVLAAAAATPQLDADDDPAGAADRPEPAIASPTEEPAADGPRNRGKIIVLATAASSLLAAAVFFAILPQLLPLLGESPTERHGSGEDLAVDYRAGGGTDARSGDARRQAVRRPPGGDDGGPASPPVPGATAEPGERAAPPAIDADSETPAAEDRCESGAGPSAGGSAPAERRYRSRPRISFGGPSIQAAPDTAPEVPDDRDETELVPDPPARGGQAKRLGRVGAADDAAATEEAIPAPVLEELIRESERFQSHKAAGARAPAQAQAGLAAEAARAELGIRFLLDPDAEDGPLLTVRLRNRTAKDLAVGAGSLRLEGLDREGAVVYRLPVVVEGQADLPAGESLTFRRRIAPADLPTAKVAALRLTVAERHSGSVPWTGGAAVPAAAKGEGGTEPAPRTEPVDP